MLAAEQKRRQSLTYWLKQALRQRQPPPEVRASSKEAGLCLSTGNCSTNCGRRQKPDTCAAVLLTAFAACCSPAGWHGGVTAALTCVTAWLSKQLGGGRGSVSRGDGQVAYSRGSTAGFSR